VFSDPDLDLYQNGLDQQHCLAQAEFQPPYTENFSLGRLYKLPHQSAKITGQIS
jgi:hypothetical protein